MFKYRGVAKDGRKSRRFKGLYSEDGWRNLKRPVGYRVERVCVECGGIAWARGYCRHHYDGVFRKHATDLAPKHKKYKLKGWALRDFKRKKRKQVLQRGYAITLLGVRDALRFLSFLRVHPRVTTPLESLGE